MSDNRIDFFWGLARRCTGHRCTRGHTRIPHFRFNTITGQHPSGK